jgi:hypothetical protein
MSNNLNPDKALIFRIVHRDNVPWVLDNGMHCRHSPVQALHYRTIGNPDLIEKRQHREVPIPPGGSLSDYVPFYFTPYSPMMLNIKTGYGGIIPAFVFADRHAYLWSANFYSELNDLQHIDWMLLQNRDFKRDPDDPGKVERYQAEALVYRHLPVAAMIGAVCYTQTVETQLKHMLDERGLNFQVVTQPGWYF